MRRCASARAVTLLFGSCFALLSAAGDGPAASTDSLGRPCWTGKDAWRLYHRDPLRRPDPSTREYQKPTEGGLYYWRITGHTPDYTNLAVSLRNPLALLRGPAPDDSRLPPELRPREGVTAGSDAALVLKATLQAIADSRERHYDLTNDVVRYYQTCEDWGVRYRCAVVLARYGIPTGRRFTRDLARRVEEIAHAEFMTPEYGELDSAIKAIEQMSFDYRFPELTNAINRCYAANILMRWSCRRAMERYDAPAAARMRREEMRNPMGELHERLKDAKEYADKGDPYGYPVLREGLLWRHGERDHYDQAAALVDSFRPFDGRAYDETGAKVDLRALLAESAATNEAFACEIRARFQELLKLRSQETNQDGWAAWARGEVVSKGESLWARAIRASLYASENGWLFGYPTVREALLSRDAYTRKKALEALEAFRKFDGQVYDEAGNTIAVEALLREAGTTRPSN